MQEIPELSIPVSLYSHSYHFLAPVLHDCHKALLNNQVQLYFVLCVYIQVTEENAHTNHTRNLLHLSFMYFTITYKGNILRLCIEEIK